MIAILFCQQERNNILGIADTSQLRQTSICIYEISQLCAIMKYLWDKSLHLGTLNRIIWSLSRIVNVVNSWKKIKHISKYKSKVLCKRHSALKKKKKATCRILNIGIRNCDCSKCCNISEINLHFQWKREILNFTRFLRT